MSRPYRTHEDERDVFRALAHPARRLMISAAMDAPRSFEQMAQLIRRSKATVAEHLRILREARLLTIIHSGRSTSYKVNQQVLHSGTRWLIDIALSKWATGADDAPHGNAA